MTATVMSLITHDRREPLCGRGRAAGYPAAVDTPGGGGDGGIDGCGARQGRLKRTVIAVAAAPDDERRCGLGGAG
jgi:hypothetical protein